MSMKSYKILVVEDTATTIYAYKQIINDNPQLSIYSFAESIEDFQKYVNDLNINVVLMDLYLPDKTGDSVDYEAPNPRGLAEGLKLKKIRSDVGVLFTSIFVVESAIRIIRNSKHQGGLGFIQKGASMEELVFALKQVAQGERYVDQKTFHNLLQPDISPRAQLRKILNDREREILQYVAKGLSDDEIAERLIVTKRMVNRNLENIRAKLFDKKVRIGGSTSYSRVRLAHLAIALDLIRPLPVDLEKSIP